MNSANPENCDVRHNAAAGRFEIEEAGHSAVVEYRLDGELTVFTHTFVPPELRGRGVAEKLVRAALAETRRQGRKVVAQCSYVSAFIRQNPEYHDLLA
ncbi:MAG: GNAT family N-acetyltransferase [Opitutaceae bacterium]|nr:GNAT family N-acetyltransferase [Opitutaceae bacterium]